MIETVQQPVVPTGAIDIRFAVPILSCVPLGIVRQSLIYRKLLQYLQRLMHECYAAPTPEQANEQQIDSLEFLPVHLLRMVRG